jgi:hypothetical protein
LAERFASEAAETHYLLPTGTQLSRMSAMPARAKIVVIMQANDHNPDTKIGGAG